MPLLSLKKSLLQPQHPAPFAAIHALQSANALRLAGNAQAREQQARWAEIARQPNSTVLEQNGAGSTLLATCMNPRCGTNWLRLWRHRQQPRFEGQWACSPECMREMIDGALERELGDGAGLEPVPHRHRIPLGLVLLHQGWITREQLRAALDAQRTHSRGRIGAWLMEQCGIPEERITRALSMQWGCPVLSFTGHQPGTVATLVPRLLLDTYGLLPLRVTAGRIAYLAFEDHMDAIAAHAIGRMNGVRVETGLVAGSEYGRAHERMMSAAFPKVQLIQAADLRAAGAVLTETIERVRPQDARLVRMHRYFWLRLWRTPAAPAAGATPVPRLHQVEDVLVAYGSNA